MEKIKTPNLTKMTSEELKRYRIKAIRKYWSYGDGSQWDKEYRRVNQYLFSKEKKIVIAEKDIAEIIKKKKRMREDRRVVVSGVGIICDYKDNATHRLSVEYYF